MSLKAVVWAFENDEVFSSAQKFVLVALANYANDEGKSYPAVATLCRITMQSDDTVRRCLKQLADFGIIRDTGKRFGPTQQVKVWELPVEAWQFKDPQGAGLLRGARPPEDPGKTPPRPREDPQGAGQSLEPRNSKKEKEGGFAPSRRFSDGWLAAYKEVFGQAYIYSTKDGVQAARLLKSGVTPDDALAVARAAWVKSDEKKFWACVNQSKEIPKFVAAFNAIRRELSDSGFVSGSQKPKIDPFKGIDWCP